MNEVRHERQALAYSEVSLKQAKMKFTNEREDVERYQAITANNIKKVSEEPVSTFSIDVDTAAYSNIRRVLNQGRLPHTDMVRTEELINYFQYGYNPPENKKQPFSVNT